MRVPAAAWWVIAPLAWVWQYLAYVPAHVLAHTVLYVIGSSGSDWKIELRPWFLDRLR